MKWTGLFFLLGSLPCFAQLDPTYSQFSLNKIFLNPGYAGTTKRISSSLVFKSQFGTAEMSRLASQSLSVHTPVNYERIGVGMTIQNEKFYETNILNVAGIFSYKIKLKQGFLSFGMQGGLQQYRLNDYNLLIKDNPDQVLGGKNNSLVADIGAGLYYYNKHTYIGISSKHLNRAEVNFTDYIFSSGHLKRQHYLIAGHNFSLPNNFMISPAMLIKYVNGVSPQTDFNCLIYYKNIWTGLSLLAYHRLGFQFGLPVNAIYKWINEEIKISYSYDFPLSTYNIIFRQTHEILMTVDFDMSANLKRIKRKGKVVSPLLF